MSPQFLRLAYICEFWLVLLTVHVVWPQAGGQGHLDVMMWYWKLALPIVLAGAVVGMTIAASEAERFWNGKTIGWLSFALVLTIVMAGVTYYYHLHENDNLEEAAAEETASIFQAAGDCRGIGSDAV